MHWSGSKQRGLGGKAKRRKRAAVGKRWSSSIGTIALGAVVGSVITLVIPSVYNRLFVPDNSLEALAPPALNSLQQVDSRMAKADSQDFASIFHHNVQVKNKGSQTAFNVKLSIEPSSQDEELQLEKVSTSPPGWEHIVNARDSTTPEHPYVHIIELDQLGPQQTLILDYVGRSKTYIPASYLAVKAAAKEYKEMVHPGPGLILSTYGLDDVRQGQPYLPGVFSPWGLAAVPPTVAYKTYGMDFSPYVNGQDPNLGTEITEAQITARMQIIGGDTVWVRSFGCTHGLEKVDMVAHSLDLKAAVGAWLRRDPSANNREIANLISAANAGQVDLAIVGSEVLARNCPSLSNVNLGGGSWQIYVQDSAGSAHSAAFTVQAPASPPTISGFTWDQTPTGDQAFNGTITGTNFVTGRTSVFFCVYGSTTCYQQPAAGVNVTSSSSFNISNVNLSAGSWQTYVPTSTGSSAKSTAFTVQAPASPPAISGFRLDRTPSGGHAFNGTITGTNFLTRGSQVFLCVSGSSNLSESQLIADMNQVRQQIPDNNPVATADVYEKLLEHPAVIAACYVVLPDYYPYWEGVSVNTAIATLHRQHQLVVAAAQGKLVIVSETGWPGGGNVLCNAVPSPANASLYSLNFVSWAPANKVSYSYFDALDEAWKANHGEGPQGAHWGVWDKDGVLKPGMHAVVDGQTMADNWTSAGVPGGPGTPSMECAYVTPSGSSNNLFGQVFHVNTDDYKVAVYIHVGDWWTKPTFANPLTNIGLDGSWERDITTGGNDPLATQIVAYLGPKTFSPPAMLGGQTLPPTLDQNAVANTQIQTRNFVALPKYTVALSASPAAGGTVSGGVTFASGSLRTVTATANSGYTFVNWTENGSVVSSSATYAFTLSNNRGLAYEAKESLSNRDKALRIKVLESGGSRLEVQSTDDQESSASPVLLPTRPVKVSIVDSGGSQLSILTSVNGARSDKPAVEMRKERVSGFAGRILKSVVPSEAPSLRQTCDKTTGKLVLTRSNRWTRWRLQPVTNVNKSYEP